MIIRRHDFSLSGDACEWCGMTGVEYLQDPTRGCVARGGGDISEPRLVQLMRESGKNLVGKTYTVRT